MTALSAVLRNMMQIIDKFTSELPRPRTRSNGAGNAIVCRGDTPPHFSKIIGHPEGSEHLALVRRSVG